jgi:hypothetical protein
MIMTILRQDEVYVNIFSALQKVAVLRYQNSEEMSDFSKSETDSEVASILHVVRPLALQWKLLCKGLEGSCLHVRAV